MRGKAWTQKELDFLRDNYSTMTDIQISNVLGRPRGSIRTKCSQLGLFKEKHTSWTEEEEALLKANYKNLTTAQLTELFPGRSFFSVEGALRRLNLKKSSDCS